jgi:hypothetical protein
MRSQLSNKLGSDWRLIQSQYQRWAATLLAQKRSVAALFLCKYFIVLAPLRYATLRYSAFSGKNGQKTAVAQRSGPFLRACTRSVSVDVAEFRYATLKLRGIPLRYAALTATVSVAGPALPIPSIGACFDPIRGLDQLNYC